MSTITIDYFNRWMRAALPGGVLYDFTDKETAVTRLIHYMLARTQSMFTWEGLPDSIPARSLELLLQINGYAGFAKVDGELYAFYGGLGGEPDAYYRPTIFTVANPALKYSANLKINKDCIIMLNDSLLIGLTPMMCRYCTLLAENDISLRMASINSRIFDLIAAPDDRTKIAAEQFLRQVEAGKMGVIADNVFLDGIRSQPYGSTANSNVITNLIELEQYIKASMYNELGLNANYNMKRESLNSAESQLNDDALLPLVDDMLECRQYAAEKVNDMFGTEISVRLASSWEDNQIELDMAQDSIEEDPEEVKDDADIN